MGNAQRSQYFIQFSIGQCRLEVLEYHGYQHLSGVLAGGPLLGPLEYDDTRDTGFGGVGVGACSQRPCDGDPNGGTALLSITSSGRERLKVDSHDTVGHRDKKQPAAQPYPSLTCKKKMCHHDG